MKKQIQLKVSELKPALAGFSKVIERRATLPVLGCVFFQSNQQGQIQMTGTNLDDFVTRSIPGTAAPGYAAALPLEPLKRFARSCPETTTLTIETVGREEATIHFSLAGTQLVERIATCPVEDFPKPPKVDWQGSTSVGMDFKEALLQAFLAACSDESRATLHHAYIDASDPGGHYIVGTDGRQLFAANSFQFDLQESLIFPNRSFLSWKGFMEDGDWSLTLGVEPKKSGKTSTHPGWVRVSSKDWTFITRQIDATYPNWKQVVPLMDQKTVVTLNDSAMDLLSMAVPRLPGGEDHLQPVGILVLEDGAVMVQGEDNKNSVTLPVAGASVEGDPIRRRINRTYLLKALKLGLKELELYPQDYILVFRAGGRKLLVACLRDDDASEPIPASSPTQTPVLPSATAPVPVTSSSTGQETQPSEEPNEEMKTINRIENHPQETSTANGVATSASAFEQVRVQVEAIKDKLKGAVTDLNETLKLLAQAQRERRATEKEVEEVRATLQSLQRIRI